MKIIIIGADGQLGTDLCRVIPPSERVALTIKDLDITNQALAAKIVKQLSPATFINTAAYHHVDNCEDNLDPAFAVNTYGVKYLAQACRDNDAILVHISTDYVFDGQKGSPYVETDAPNPQSIYAISKYAGEQCVKYLLPKHFLVRTAGLYGTAGCQGKGGVNFVELMLKKAGQELRVVSDEITSPTYSLDLARQIYKLIQTKHYGLYHAADHGSCSWHEFASKIFELLGKKVAIHKTTKAEYKTRARRPAFSALKNEGLQRSGLDIMRPWPEALKAYLVEKGCKKS
ncbi:dTDP-4-dehydrorhamnose reductase [Candidatus Saganbacteria bacterium]|nr:dTDP-4-dehydrorhamnose reductase [Candidatus Saganbacteria bacterium]